MGVWKALDIFQDQMSTLMEKLDFSKFISGISRYYIGLVWGELSQGWEGYEETPIGWA